MFNLTIKEKIKDELIEMLAVAGPLPEICSAEELKSSSAEEQKSRSAEAYSPFTLHASPITNNYFYFLNGQGDVTYFSDANFTPEQVETYEYNFFGIPNNIGNKNSLLFNGFEYDIETNLYRIGSTFYNPSIGLVLKNLNYGREAVPVAMPFIIYPEKINEVIVSMMPVDEEPPEPMSPPTPAPFCGNGKKESGEQCDDGDTDNNDCCDTNCKDTGNCRPFKQTPKGFECDLWVYISLNGRIYKICVPLP